MLRSFRLYFDPWYAPSTVIQQRYALVKYAAVMGAVIVYKISLPKKLLNNVSNPKGLIKQAKQAALHNYTKRTTVK